LTGIKVTEKVEVVKEKDNVVEATTEIKLVVNGMT
jgi:hypothetical protein